MSLRLSRRGAISAGAPAGGAVAFAADTLSEPYPSSIASNELLLDLHRSAEGGWWGRHGAYGIRLAHYDGRVRRRQTDTGTALYLYSRNPASADYTVSATVKVEQAPSGTAVALVAARVSNASTDTGVFVEGHGTNGWQLFEKAAGVRTNIGSAAAQTWTVGQTYAVELQVQGTTVTVRVDGVQKATGTTSAAGAGYAGVGSNSYNSFSLASFAGDGAAVAAPTVTSVSSDAALSTALTNAANGTIIELASGAYTPLTVSQTKGFPGVMLRPAGGATVTVQGVTFTSTARWIVCDSIDFYEPTTGVTGSGVPDAISLANGCSQIRFWGGKARGGKAGIKSNGGASTTDVGWPEDLHFYGMEVYGNGMDNCQCDGVRKVRWQNCVHRDPVVTTDHHDCWQCYGVEEFVIDGCRAFHTAPTSEAGKDQNQGILINQEAAATRYARNGLIVNTIVDDIPGTPVQLLGIDNVRVVNNLIYESSFSYSSLVTGTINSVPPTNMIVANNLMRRWSGASNGTGHTQTHNHVTDGTGGGTNLTSGDPLFVTRNDGNYTIQSGSPARNSGSATYMPTVDIDGTARVSPPDRGAKEQ